MKKPLPFMKPLPFSGKLGTTDGIREENYKMNK